MTTLASFLEGALEIPNLYPGLYFLLLFYMLLCGTLYRLATTTRKGRLP